ncbi:hypothetical protein CerSpe_268190 [Prunus speciosa]
MNMLTWNCQGLGNPSTIHALSSLIQQKVPKLVFLSETRCNKSKLETIKFRLGFSNMFVVPSRGFLGGLCLLWRDDVDLSILSYSSNHIDATCDNIGIEGKWRLTGFYGCPQSADRSFSWNLLSTLGQHSSLPWICFGDFNEILSVSEKRGGRTRANRLMEAFWSVLLTVISVTWALLAVLLPGPPLGLAVSVAGLIGLLQIWPGAIASLDLGLSSYPPSKSDHLPIIIEVRDGAPTSWSRPRRRFRFEEFWLHHEECESVVRSGWERLFSGVPLVQFCAKIKATSLALAHWAQCTFGQTQKEIVDIRNKLGALWNQLPSTNGFEAQKLLMERLDSLLYREEIYWRQRSRVSWLKMGDRNTGFFHQHASNRRRQNLLKGLRDAGGIWHDDPIGIQATVIDYFKNIFATQGDDPRAIQGILDVVDPKVTSEMNMAYAWISLLKKSRLLFFK